MGDIGLAFSADNPSNQNRDSDIAIGTSDKTGNEDKAAATSRSQGMGGNARLESESEAEESPRDSEEPLSSIPELKPSQRLLDAVKRFAARCNSLIWEGTCHYFWVTEVVVRKTTV